MRLIFLYFLLIVEASEAIEVVCSFETLAYWGYTCVIENQTVKDDGKLMFNVDAIDPKKSLRDVNCVEFFDSEIDFVPKSVFSTFKSVDKLIFIDNNFSQWSREFLKIGVTLKAFVNAENLIEMLEDDSFVNAPDLQILSLYNNRIADISTNAFRGLKQLQTLQLSGNNLESLDGDLFKDLGHLNTLDLFDNELSLLPLKIFDNCMQIDTIRLDGNKLTMIVDGVFSRHSSLKSLNLTNNLIFSIDAKVLPKKLQTLYVDFQVNVINAPASLEIVRPSWH